MSPGAAFLRKKISFKEDKEENLKDLELCLWDTAGTERFNAISSTYYRGAHGVIFVYDVTRPDSFQNLKNWMENVEIYCADNVAKILVANKVDLDNHRVKKAVAWQLAREFKMMFMEVSAKDGDCVADAFEELIEKILETPELVQVEDSVVNLEQPTEPRSWYCCYLR